MVLLVVNKIQKVLLLISILFLLCAVLFSVVTFSMYKSRDGYSSKTVSSYLSNVSVCELALEEYNNRTLHNSSDEKLKYVKKYFPNEFYGYSEVILKDMKVIDILVKNNSEVRLLVEGISESGSKLRVTWEFLFSDGNLVDFYTVRW